MKKKKISILITMCLLLFIGINKVKAVDGGTYNGSGSNPTSTTTTGSCNVAGSYCPWGNTSNGSFGGVKISLYYIKEGEYFSVKDISGNVIQPQYITNINPGNYSNWKTIINNLSIAKGEPKTNSLNVSKFFGAVANVENPITNQKQFAAAFETIFGISLDNVNFTEESIAASSKTEAKYGYRIIIEPVFQYKYGTDSKSFYYFTAKEIAGKVANGSGHTCKKTAGDCVTSLQETSKAFFTSFDDVGITAKTEDQCNTSTDTKMVSSATSGCGYNIIDITQVVKSPCYSQKIDGSLTCKYNDRNNESGNFTETYTRIDNCSKEQQEENKNYSEYGKIIESNNDNCKLYCAESAFASFPGGISADSEFGRNIILGGYFAWPKAYDSADFNMHMTSTLTCRIVAKEGKTCSKDDAVKVEKAALNYLNTLSFAANLTAGTNKPISDQALVAVKTYTEEPSTIDWETTNQKTKSFSVRKTVYFEINSSTNRYHNLATGEVSNTFINGYFDRNYGNISHSLNDDIEKTYDLKISSVQLGSGNQYGKLITNYVCHYNLTGTCKCPDDKNDGSGSSKIDVCYPGRDLSEYIKIGYTCLEAQSNFCGSDSITPPSGDCTYKCNNNKDIDITTCVEKEWKTGKYTNMDYVVDVCTRKEQKCQPYYCINDPSIEITNCVYNEEAPGKNVVDNPEDIANARIKCEEKERSKGNCTGGNGNKCSDDVAKCQMKGKSLYECQIENNPSCKNKPIDEIADCLKDCPSTCYYKGQPIPQYLECISKGGNASVCYSAWCESEKCDPNKEPCYYCPGTNIDITKCVIDKVAASANDGNDVLETNIPTAITECAAEKPECNGGNGGTCKVGCKWITEKHSKTTYYYKKCSDSKEICDTKVVYCPDNKCQKIIYRVIDLNNPFPGKEGEGVTSDFSNGGTGRFPNANWNYVETVKEEILNARGAKGDELYKLKPLYTIVLTPENIREIKSKSSGKKTGYNNKNKYSDFTLDCKGSSKHDACISSFLHSGKYVTIDTNNSVCGNITNSEEFHACYDRIN